MNLFLFAYPNNVHCSPCGKIIMCITYANQFIAIWLVKIVKWFGVSQLVLLNFLLTLITFDEFSNKVRDNWNMQYIVRKSQSCHSNWKIPPVVHYKGGRSNGSCVQDQKFGKHETSLKGKFWWLLLRFFLAYQTESPQIYQNDCNSIYWHRSVSTTINFQAFNYFWFIICELKGGSSCQHNNCFISKKSSCKYAAI